ncbi:MAG TPA: hypothetical protein VJB14_17630, partial [Planctomycetota bacterium]|nr:hypothetical protein [Planctomycetota bacterium]
TYKDADGDGNKEWVIDVYLGAADGPDLNVVKDCPIAPYARELVTDLRLPVTIERSVEGKYTVIGRSKVIPAGANGDIDDPTYRLTMHNYADLRARHVADLDYTLEPYQASPVTPYQADPGEPYQAIRAFNAFGRQVLGPEVVESPKIQTQAKRRKTVRHVMAELAGYGTTDWGVDVYQPTRLTTVETVEEI